MSEYIHTSGNTEKSEINTFGCSELLKACDFVQKIFTIKFKLSCPFLDSEFLLKLDMTTWEYCMKYNDIEYILPQEY